MHRSLVLQLILGGFLIGVAVSSLTIMPMWSAWLLSAFGAGCFLARRRTVAIVGCLAVGCVLGILRTTSVLSVPSTLDALAADHAHVILDGYIDSDATSAKAGVQFRFHALRATIDDGSTVRIDDGIAVFGPPGLRPRYGQVLTLDGKLQQPKSTGDFDYAAYLAKDGAHALMYFPEFSVPTDWQPSSAERIRLAVTGWLHGVRDHLADALSHAVPAPESAFLAGILVGAQGIVGNDIKDMFTRTGTSHILAISGYNITIVAAAIVALLAPLGRRRSFWLTIVGIVCFTVMVGASASVVRAAIMGVLVLASRQFGRRMSATGAIVCSAAVMCAFSPMLLRWDVGFQFSFLALLGIIFLEPLMTGQFLRAVRYKSLAQAAGTTLAASVAVLPLSLLYFGQLPVYTLPANLLVLPLVPLAMLMGLVTGVAGMMWPLAGQLVGQSAWLVAAFQLGVIRTFASLPNAAISVHVSIAAVAAVYVALVIGLFLEYRRVSKATTNQHRTLP